MTATEKIRAQVEQFPTEDRFRVAERLLDLLSHVELVEVLADEVGHQQRMVALRDEQRAFASTVAHHTPQSALQVGGKSKGGTAIAARPTVPEAFKKLFGSPFSLGDGRRVTWDMATIDEHRTRMAMLERQMSGLGETHSRHRDAVLILESTGARCLAEV